MRVRQVGIDWKLRQLMAAHGMFATTDLMPLLAERGVTLSATQVYRLVTQPPERLNVKVLAAICDALGCSPNDLIEVTISQRQGKVRAAGGTGEDGPAVTDRSARPTRVRLTEQ
ncbi:MAG: helix-turn-helix transcriptional regulator [Frankiaceae bacterium]